MPGDLTAWLGRQDFYDGRPVPVIRTRPGPENALRAITRDVLRHPARRQPDPDPADSPLPGGAADQEWDWPYTDEDPDED